MNPYKDLQLRWLYPQPPQKIFQSRYKETLQDVDYNLWINQIIPNWDNLTVSCYCQQEFPTETKCNGHLVSGDLKHYTGLLMALLSCKSRNASENLDLKVTIQCRRGFS
jgi:hypothetical protein